ncbi:MAG: trigger factor [Planctomycetota bacterium]
MNTEVEELEKEEQDLNLSVAVKETSACGRHVTVTIPRTDVERYFAKQFDDLVPKAEIPGFRPGRAPRQLVEKKFRKQLTDQVKGQLIMDSLAQVNETQDFSAISEPDLDYEQVTLPDEGDFIYEFNIEVRPDFDVPEYKGLALERPEYDFTDEDVDKEIQRFGQLGQSVLEPVDEPAKENDFVVCKITATLDGEEIAVNDDVSLKVTNAVDFADAKIEQFDQLMVGAAEGDTRNVSVELSEFADNDQLRGKTVDLEIEVLDVKRPEAADVDQIAERYGQDSEEELRKLLREILTRRLEYAQRETIRDQISGKLTEAADWNLPVDLLERQAQRELQRTVMEMRSSGFSETEIIARENQLRKDAHQRTATLLKEHFILEKIAEMESIEDEPQDYDLEVARIAAQKNDSPRRVRTRLERSGQMDALRNMIIERKVIDLITEQATFTPTDYDQGQEDDTFSIGTFVAGEKQNIPEAKYDGGEAPAIPGMDKKD